MTKTFSYIPTDHIIAPDRCDEHEYFGEDFKKGDCTIAIFETIVPVRSDKKPQRRVVWSFGQWESYGVEPNDVVTFEHTQTLRPQELRLISIHDCDNPSSESRRCVHWTLK